jgi:hypothetical protein
MWWEKWCTKALEKPGQSQNLLLYAPTFSSLLDLPPNITLYIKGRHHSLVSPDTEYQNARRFVDQSNASDLPLLGWTSHLNLTSSFILHFSYKGSNTLLHPSFIIID